MECFIDAVTSNTNINTSMLFVDDEEDLCLLFKTYMSHIQNISIDTTGSAKNARQLMSKKKYDVIVCDFQMPDETGIQFLNSLRKSGDNIPFILITGQGGVDVIRESYVDGADFYLAKSGETKSMFSELIRLTGLAIYKHKLEDRLATHAEEIRNAVTAIQSTQKEIEEQVYKIRACI